MALADYGYGTNAEKGVAPDAHVLSLKTEPTRKGYAISASDAANGFWVRAFKSVVCAMMVMMGTLLVVATSALAGTGLLGFWLLPAIGTYLIMSGMVWLVRLARRQVALHVDHGARGLHLVSRSILGAERSRKTIRFEEIVKLTLVDGLPSDDMRAHKLNWNMARIDVVWRKNKVTELIRGDAAELELLVNRLRQDVGLA